jgi:hypothetical protein
MVPIASIVLFDLILTSFTNCYGFVPSISSLRRRHNIVSHSSSMFLLSTSSSDEDNENESQVMKIKKLGYSDAEVKQSQPLSTSFEKQNVNATIIPAIDAVTLTAIGFALIGANFFIFANMGDGGIAGMVATIINLSNQ